MDRKVLHNISYGLYIVSSIKGDKMNGCVLNSVIQTSADPATITICTNRNNLTTEFIKEGGVFTVSILPKDTPMKFIGLFGFNSGREINKFKDVEYNLGEKTNVPVLKENSLGYIEAEVRDIVEVETHNLIIADIVNARSYDVDKEPLTYSYYHQVKNGKFPKSSPIYHEDEGNSGGKDVEGKYHCEICGYIYNPDEGDPDSNIEPGTPFSELPDDWVCPICGATKDKFSKV